jgi:cyclohexanecarboxyl-CoA dehydrogenase
MGCLAAGVIHEEIARADLSFSYLNLLASLNSHILSKYGNPDIVGPWLKKITAGEAVCAIALTEPRGGSDAGIYVCVLSAMVTSMSSTAKKHLYLQPDQADITVVFGRTGTPESGAHGVTVALLVPMDTKGL